jgi:hypothetical protein
MQYYVLSNDGQKYGPADVVTLSSWIGQNRLNPSSRLEEVGTGRILSASEIPGLFGAAAATPNYSLPPTAQAGNYNPGYGYQAPAYSQALTYAWVCFGVTFACSCFLLPIFGLINANKAVAEGHPGGQAARIANIILLVLYALGTIAYIGIFAAIGASGGFSPPR